MICGITHRISREARKNGHVSQILDPSNYTMFPSSMRDTIVAEIAKSYKEQMCEMADFAPAIKASSEGLEGPGSKTPSRGRIVGNALNPLDWTDAGFDSRGTLGPDYGGRCGTMAKLFIVVLGFCHEVTARMLCKSSLDAHGTEDSPCLSLVCCITEN